MKAVVCAIAKYEYDYIREWVTYNINLGFDKIVIYDNNDLDGERYDELLKDFIEAGQVELRDVRGKDAMQRVVYNEFYKEGDFDWVCIIDIDEFITMNPKYKNIKEFIEKNAHGDAIYLYWKTFGDGGKVYPSKNWKTKSVLAQYNVPANKYALIDDALKSQNSWGKSIIKKGLPVKFLHEHFIVDPADVKYVDSFGDPVMPMLCFPDINYVEKTYKECYIKHLYTKSLQEYVDCKVRRPAANTPNGIMHYPSKYFKVNEITEEKRKYLESIGYKLEFTFKPDVYLMVEVKNIGEFHKLEEYILNIKELCSCRIFVRILSSAEEAEEVNKFLSKIVTESAVYFQDIPCTSVLVPSIYEKDRTNIINHTNCVVHMSIPYGVDEDAYIKDFIDPLFCKNNIKKNFSTVLTSNNSLFVAKDSVMKIADNDETYKKYKELTGANMTLCAFTPNFIARTKDLMRGEKLFKMIENKYFENYDMLLFFISNLFENFVFIENK